MNKEIVVHGVVTNIFRKGVNKMQHRQGDILFQKIDKFPLGLKLKNTEIIVYGESTSHAHRLKGGSIFTGKDGLMYLKVAKEALVTHEEHKTIKLSKGFWAIIRQREYTPEAIRTVAD